MGMGMILKDEAPIEHIYFFVDHNRRSSASENELRRIEMKMFAMS